MLWKRRTSQARGPSASDSASDLPWPFDSPGTFQDCARKAGADKGRTLDLAKTLLEAAGWHCHAPCRALMRALARALSLTRSRACARVHVRACAGARLSQSVAITSSHRLHTHPQGPVGLLELQHKYSLPAPARFAAWQCAHCQGVAASMGMLCAADGAAARHARFCAAARHSRPPARLSPPPLSCHDGINNVSLWQKGPCAEQLAEHLLCLIRNVRPCGRTCMAFGTRNP